MNEEIVLCLADKKDLTAIADEIRELSGTTEAMGLDAMAESLQVIPRQSAQTIVPTTVDQTIASGQYLTGTQIIKGDANLVSENIVSGTSIFGVSGTAEVSSEEASQWSENEDAIVCGTIINYTNDRVNTIGPCAFYSQNNLLSINFPVCNYIGSYAFYKCSNLQSISFPACEQINNYAFAGCSNLLSINFPNCNSIGSGAFGFCDKLSTVNFPVCSIIGNSAFSSNINLKTINFPSCKYISTYAFTNCANLEEAFFPIAESIWHQAFQNCKELKNIYSPNCKQIGYLAFQSCYELQEANFPNCSVIWQAAFSECRKLSKAILTNCSEIQYSAFYRCQNLSIIQLEYSSVCNLKGSNAFQSTPFFGYSVGFSGTPYIYVPASLVEEYKSHYVWKYFSSYITAIPANLITFTINGTEYQAEEGMTWGEWVESEYNTNKIWRLDNIGQVLNYPYTIDNVLSNNIIIANQAYSISMTGGWN